MDLCPLQFLIFYPILFFSCFAAGRDRRDWWCVKEEGKGGDVAESSSRKSESNDDTLQWKSDVTNDIAMSVTLLKHQNRPQMKLFSDAVANRKMDLKIHFISAAAANRKMTPWIHSHFCSCTKLIFARR